jgi:alpha-galactosidase
MKIAIVGGGSYLWSLGFCRQFIQSERLKDIDLVLVDLDPAALALVARAAQIYRRSRGAPTRITTAMDLDSALDGAQFVVVSISTGGLDAMQHDLAIPEKYGVRHTVGDTVGPGGWSRAVRNVPVFHDIAARMKRLCPDAWLINVSNPLTPLTRTPHKSFGTKSIGMCPGVESQARRLAELAGFKNSASVDYVVTGVDHGSWFTSLCADRQDVLARLKEQGYCRPDGRLPSEVRTADPLAEAAHTRAAFAVWHEIGYLPSITDRHIVENFPWFLTQTTPDLPLHLKRTSIAERRQWKEERRAVFEKFVATGDESLLGGMGHGDDPIAAVIESLCGYRSFLYGCNYMNVGQTPGFPEGAVLETRCRLDGAGVHPLCSPMPDILKTLTLPTVLRQEMIVDIALHGTFNELVALIYTDPLCSRLLPGQCRDMVRELMQATRPWIRNPRLLEF